MLSTIALAIALGRSSQDGAPAGSHPSRHILIVVTSAAKMSSGKATGLWLEEFAVPYQRFQAAGYTITVASPKGGPAPIDPRSQADAATHPEWKASADRLKSTVALSRVSAGSFDAVFIPGGHGTMFDLPNNASLARLLTEFDAQQKVIAAVCHGPAAFVGVKRKDGRALVSGKRVAAFTNKEEAAVDLVKDMPFLLETRLREEGARVETAKNFTPHAVRDGNLITGQNPPSSLAVANLVISALAERK